MANQGGQLTQGFFLLCMLPYPATAQFLVRNGSSDNTKMSLSHLQFQSKEYTKVSKEEDFDPRGGNPSISI